MRGARCGGYKGKFQAAGGISRGRGPRSARDVDKKQGPISEIILQRVRYLLTGIKARTW